MNIASRDGESWALQVVCAIVIAEHLNVVEIYDHRKSCATQHFYDCNVMDISWI